MRKVACSLAFLSVACADGEPADQAATTQSVAAVVSAPAPSASSAADCAGLDEQSGEVKTCGTPDSKAAEKLQAQATHSRKHALGPFPVELPTDGPRVYAKSRFVWVRPEPNSGGGWVGYLWLGGSAKLKTGEPVNGPGCMKWYEIEPFGFVCVDGKLATLDPKDTALLSTLPYAPQTSSPWPHAYGESRGLQKYKTIPTRKDQRKREWDLPKHEEALKAAQSGGKVAKSLQGVDLAAAHGKLPTFGDYPSTLNQPRNRLLNLSTVAYSAEAHADGRDWLLTADFTWVPKTRVVPYPKVLFQGVELGKDASWPVAFFRQKDRDAYRKTSGGLQRVPAAFKRLSWVELSGKELEHDGKRYLQTKAGDLWLAAKDAVLPELREPPWEAAQAPGGRQTWMEANVWKGWLVAYEGKKPVYVTLISPGRGGTPEPGKPAIDTASTPTGTFKITGKFATATMVAPHDFIHSDVPWTQNFSGPHALHGAYWHDNWGERMSAGCVNVSPIDGKWLFEFTEPAVPPGWHGVRWRPKDEPATTFIVR